MANCLPKWPCHFSFPPTRYEDSRWSAFYLHLLSVIWDFCLFFFFHLGILVAVKWYLILVLFCFVMMTNNVEYIFIGWFFIQVSSLVKCLFISLIHVVNKMFYSMLHLKILHVFWMQVLFRLWFEHHHLKIKSFFYFYKFQCVIFFFFFANGLFCYHI